MSEMITSIAITLKKTINFHIKCIFAPIFNPYFWVSFNTNRSSKFDGYLRRVNNFGGIYLCGTNSFSLFMNCFFICSTFYLYIILRSFWAYFLRLYWLLFWLDFLRVYMRESAIKLLAWDNRIYVKSRSFCIFNFIYKQSEVGL